MVWLRSADLPLSLILSYHELSQAVCATAKLLVIQYVTTTGVTDNGRTDAGCTTGHNNNMQCGSRSNL